MHLAIVYGALLAWVGGCLGDTAAARIGAVFASAGATCGAGALVWVWHLHAPAWTIEWVARTATMASMFVGCLVWDGVMSTVFFTLGGSMWESAVFVPVIAFTVASYRLQWRAVGTCVQWVVLVVAVCAAAARWFVHARSKEGLHTVAACKGFGGWEWCVFVVVAMWPMLSLAAWLPVHGEVRECDVGACMRAWEEALHMRLLVVAVAMPAFVALVNGMGDHVYLFAVAESLETLRWAGIDASAAVVLTSIGIACMIETCR